MRIRILVGLVLLSAIAAQENRGPIVVVYPENGSVFPPEFTAPTFLFRDTGGGSGPWPVEISFADGSPALRTRTIGERASVGAIDPRAVSETNRPPEALDARTWVPDSQTWAAIKSHTAATVTIGGSAPVRIEMSPDPVGAPIFYRDVPLMPSEVERGVIKPLAPNAIPLISWRLRDIGQPASRVLLEGLHTCANCHSFSRDGKTLGMDVDGPENDKGTYAIAAIAPTTVIRTSDVLTWNSFADRPSGHHTLGFLAQISPDGRYALATLNEEVFVANFNDYRFLQVFYPTRGILGWYDRTTGVIKRLPGADDARYVQTDGVWSPDGRYIVFARAQARDAYPAGAPLAERANDPNEPQIRYDLYRIPFNGGRGGKAEPIAGASRNGMSNSFPKVSPDGRWLVFVQARNGQLMRPDGRLYIVPVGGGVAREMRCNTPLMNSWHSWSPNGRWMVFSSKGRSPYTQMYLTHVDADGKDTPPILVENSTAANRAVNLPEFVNVPPGGLLQIEMPAAEFYTRFDRALELASRGELNEAISEWNRALEIDASNAKAHNNLGALLSRVGRPTEATAEFRKAVDLDPNYADAHYNLGGALAAAGRSVDAMAEWRRAAALAPDDADIQNRLGLAYAGANRLDDAISHWQAAIRLRPDFPEVRYGLGRAFYLKGRMAEAVAQWRELLRAAPNDVAVLNRIARVLATCPDASVRNGADAVAFAERAAALARNAEVLDTLAAAYAEAGRFDSAVRTAEAAEQLAPGDRSVHERLELYRAHHAYRER